MDSPPLRSFPAGHFFRPGAGRGAAQTGVGDPAEASGAGPREGARVAHFALLRRIGKGGMGEVWEAWDEDLRRPVALKFVLPERIDLNSLERFEREARAGGRLAHPNVVRTLAYGKEGGRAWIAQELVEGSWTLKDFLDEQRAAEGVPKGYDRQVATLVALLADGLQAAHEAGVIHRDLKPQNILVAADDTPKIADFGLARVSQDSFLSVTGDFAGTYHYMSPEQVTAKRMGLDHRTDIFSLGVVLYELLTLRLPFEGDSTHQISEKILYLDPPDPVRIRSQCPRDLSSICGKALEKAPSRRYQTMAELAADLRRHLANEPILARPPGPLALTGKWARRHPGLSSAAAVGALALVVVSGSFAANVRTSRALERSNLDLNEQTELALVNAGAARQAQLEAERRTADVLSLSSQMDLDHLVARATTLWPPGPELLPSYERWLAGARLLQEGRPEDVARGVKARPGLADHRAKLAELGSRSVPESDPERLAAARSHARYGELEALRASDADPGRAAGASLHERRAELIALEIEVGQRTFENPEDDWWYRQLSALVAGIEDILHPETGLAGDTVAAPFGWGLQRRRAFAASIAERSVEGEEAHRLWGEAISAIASSPRYGGLVISPQLGLLPIGSDADSGLWEFAHLMSGDPAQRDENSKLFLTEETGIVLVLISGTVGNEARPRSDPPAVEGRVDEPLLTPYFLSKYELTQGQWKRLTGSNPSAYGLDGEWELEWQASGAPPTLLHPLEQVTWLDCDTWLTRAGLALPSEAQWLRAARGGRALQEVTGPEYVASLRGVANLRDAHFEQHAKEFWRRYESEHDDGSAMHWEVGRRTPNPFGLHEIHGNVSEWCQDSYEPIPFGGDPGVNPVAAESRDRRRVYRGGGFRQLASEAGFDSRSFDPPSTSGSARGVRPARVVMD